MIMLTPDEMMEIETLAVIEFLELSKMLPKESKKSTVFYNFCLVRAAISYLVKEKPDELDDLLDGRPV